MTAYHKAGATI